MQAKEDKKNFSLFFYLKKVLSAARETRILLFLRQQFVLNNNKS